MMGGTVKVRIAVAIDPKGRWVAHGWRSNGGGGPENHAELLDTYDYDVVGPSERLFWVTAFLPVPNVDEVPGHVERPDTAARRDVEGEDR